MKRFTQVKGIDFQEASKPAARYTTTRPELSVSVTIKHVRRALNVKNAFVNAPLNESYDVSQLDGFVGLGKEYWVYVLRKALYALRQASRKWHMTVHNFLRDSGFEQFRADPTLYVWGRNESFLMIVV